MSEALNVCHPSNSLALTQKELGAYYTHPTLTTALSKWAIRSSKEHILEPSFGGCGFLQSAVSQLLDIGCKHPHTQLYGCDIDPVAFNFLSEKLNAIENINKRFLHKDFLKVLPDDFLTIDFDTIIGNPPYISVHNLSSEQKESVETWIANNPTFKISKRSSLWAYFVLHSASFLKQGGRMAWVLPGSFLQAHYGIELQKLLLDRFGQVIAINLGERVFLAEGTQERTVILLCSEHGESTQDIKVSYCESLDDLATTLDSTQKIEQLEDNVLVGGLLDDIYETISNRDDIHLLGDLARVLIGTVTGANKFFVLSPSEVATHRLKKEYLNPILSKFAHIKGLEITSEDFIQWQLEDHRCLIFHVEDESKASGTAKVYAATFDEDLKSNNETFKKRVCWLASDDKRIPDAFLSYMNHLGPRLALNSALINSTNSIHRVFFNEGVTLIQKKLAVISLHSTFSQLSSEIEGRNYGSGVLKLEPSEAKKIRLVLPRDKTDAQVIQAFAMIDTLWREGNLLAAQDLADSFIFGNNSEIRKSLTSSLQKIRRQRKRS